MYFMVVSSLTNFVKIFFIKPLMTPSLSFPDSSNYLRTFTGSRTFFLLAPTSPSDARVGQ